MRKAGVEVDTRLVVRTSGLSSAADFGYGSQHLPWEARRTTL
jgi:hypothetical protein